MRSWFQWGTMEDREEAWSVLEVRSRLRMLGANAAWRWPSPWPERFEATVRMELAADDAMRRYRALFSALGNAELSPDLVAEAERILERELEAAEARRDDVRPTLDELTAMRDRREAKQQEREAAERRRELLTPR